MADVEPEKQMLIMPRDWVTRTVKADIPCVFIEWFRSLPWSQDPRNNQRQRVDEVLWQYCVGRWTDGRVVFWYIDEQGRPRGGKIMTYQPNGKRYHEKKDEPNSTTWIHWQRGKSGQPLCDMKTYGYRHLLFGSHLLNRYPKATVNIVESEKTALICAVAYGHPEYNLWLACGGLNFFKMEHIKPLIDAGRRIWLWPDKDGVEKWREKLTDVLSDRVAMTTKFIDDNWTDDDGEKADVADIILRHIQYPKSIRIPAYSAQGERATNKKGSGGATENNDTAASAHGAASDPLHRQIMAETSSWQQEHPDGEAFTEAMDAPDPRVREWRQRMSLVHSSGWGKCAKSNIEGVKTVGEIIEKHPLIKKLLE